MSLAQEYNQRVAGNFEGLAVSLIVGTFALFGEAMAESPATPDDTSVNALLVFVQSYPALITIGGLLFAVAAAGPIGFVGFIFEIGGVRHLFVNPMTGLVFILLGAGFIVVGSKIWRWMPVIEYFLSNSRSTGRAGYRRR